MADKEFEERINLFVIELESLLKIFKKININDRNITNLKSPLLTNYLLWRILYEIKGLKIKDI